MSDGRKFNYNPKRDIVAMFIGIVFAIIGFFILWALMTWLISTLEPRPNEIPMYERIKIGVLVILAIIYALYCIYKFIGIFGNTHQELTVNFDRITYSYNWLSESEKSVPASKVKSCSKYATLLQRMCGTMDITVTTAGDDVEIYFKNIDNGDEAYRRICVMTDHILE